MTAQDILTLTRRDFLVSTARGVGGLALASLLKAEGLLAAEASSPTPARSTANPLTPRAGHLPPRARACIFLYMEGGVSQVDLFDPKPKLRDLDGQKLPDSLTQNVRFAFLQKDTAKLMASPHPFRRYGQSGLEISAL